MKEFADDNFKFEKKKWYKVFQTGKKKCGKRRNCSLRTISPFPSVFKRLVLQTRKKQGLFGKGLKKEKPLLTLSLAISFHKVFWHDKPGFY